MIKINWLVRFKNITFVVPFITSIVAFIYQILSFFNIVPPVSQDNVTQCTILIINLLVTMGILVDPTTKGVGDSQQAQGYDAPN